MDINYNYCFAANIRLILGLPNNTWYRRELLPQGFTLPPTRETHGSNVNIRIFGKERINLRFHIILWRYDVQEIFNDTEVKVDSKTISRQCNPTARRTIGNHWANGVLLIPHAGMMATGITRQRDDSKP